MTHPTPQGPQTQGPQALPMPAVNQVTIACRLKHDPEYRITDQGRRRSTFRLEVTRSWRDRDGEWQDEACYFNVVAFDEAAEHVCCYARKADPGVRHGQAVFGDRQLGQPAAQPRPDHRPRGAGAGKRTCPILSPPPAATHC